MNTMRHTATIGMLMWWLTTVAVITTTTAFVPSITTTTTRPLSTRVSAADAASSSLVVVSPPGGVGEVCAVQSAALGTSVRWFLVSSSPESLSVELSADCLDRIAAAGGSVELAGATVSSLLNKEDESAVSAVSQWCGSADAVVVTMDGVEEIYNGGGGAAATAKNKDAREQTTSQWKDAVKVAAKEAAKGVSGTRIVIVSAADSEGSMAASSNGAEEEKEGLFGGLFGSKATIPATLTDALSPVTVTLRHGELFGLPESSPEFSALLGGPRRDPELCEEYSQRAIRVDPTLSMAGNILLGKFTRSSRLAVGEAAALLVADKVPLARPSSSTTPDVCVSSLPGTDPVDLETWVAEFDRVERMMQSGQAAQLFSTDCRVPDVERLADWLTQKWAPAVLRTYDIAAIRTGARPVYARRSTTGSGTLEIVWQELVDFQSVTVGTMDITVTEEGLTATRGAGDAAAGFGSISPTPLGGENVLVRRLAEAASQAMEKGLAIKPKSAVKVDPPKPVQPVPATTIQSSGDVPATSSSNSESGPRQAGARRSPERKRRKSAPKE